MPTTVLPNDRFNRELVANVRPPNWKNPEAADRYNLVVIGAGPAGLVTASVAAGLGAKVALIERDLMGGDCLNFGCIPSKSVVRTARAWASIDEGAEFGLEIPERITRRFDIAMERMRKLRSKISNMDSAKRYADLGVDVFIGEGRFVGQDAIDVSGTTLRFSRAAICTGSRASMPSIEGLAKINFLNNETVFSLTSLPHRLAVIGAGPVGCELAQSFARFGSQVTLFEQASHILPKEDIDASTVVQTQMAKDGISFVFDSVIKEVDQLGSETLVRFSVGTEERELNVDKILVSVGRIPNVECLGLDVARVSFDKTGVIVNPYLQTSNPKVFAAGDVCFPFKFTHAADAMAQIVIKNTLFPHPFGLGMASTESLIIPWCIYTEPEIAHVGMYATDAITKGINIETFTQNFNEIDRAILDGKEEGFARIHVKRGTDEIIGATIVGNDAGNIISEVTLAMESGSGLGAIGSTIHPYPTQAEVLRKTANKLRRARFSKWQKSLLNHWFAYKR
jgi:pyruvate/2-oxoglutarate dehydrogenase complex dihydrolipoamide dehydrogenase (E3) component